jgi:hypothetical protein
VTACGRNADPKIIEGHWVAESFRIQSLKLPIGPDLFISRDSFGLGSGLEPVELIGIEADGSEVTLKTKFGFDVVFYVENKDRMYFTVPFVGDRIYYRRANNTTTSVFSPMISGQGRENPAPVAKAEQETQSSKPSTVLAAPVPLDHSARDAQDSPSQVKNSDELSVSEAHYQQALASLRQGDEDESIRSLSAALISGFSDWRRIERERLFYPLRDDMRFQVLQARWKKE